MRSLNSSNLDITGCVVVTPQFCNVSKARRCCRRRDDSRKRRRYSREFIIAYGRSYRCRRRCFLGRSPDGARFAAQPPTRRSAQSGIYYVHLTVSYNDRRYDFNGDRPSSSRPKSVLRNVAKFETNVRAVTDQCRDTFVEFAPDVVPRTDVVGVKCDPITDIFRWFGEMKNKKKGSTAIVTVTDESPSSLDANDASRPGILKSALKRSSSKKFTRKKHRVQFDESLNKFFEADYVILVRDDDYDDEYGRCECGNQFCYEGCYYEDEDEDELYEQSVDSPRYDFATAFDPPLDFVDPVTLSPPDGYKDGCCPEATMATHKTFADAKIRKEGTRPENRDRLRNDQSVKYNEKLKNQDNVVDNATTSAKNDSRNQGYIHHSNDVNASGQMALYNGTTAPSSGSTTNAATSSRYIVETITMTTVTERRIVRESNEQLNVTDVCLPTDKYNGGILKGGKLWRNQDPASTTDPKSASSIETITPDSYKKSGEGIDDKRAVKFLHQHHHENSSEDGCDKGKGYEKGEFTLTFKLGNRVVPCNSLKPNSAVRQLFPDPRFANPPAQLSELECDEMGKCEGKYLVTEESLRAFNEVNKRSVFATFSGKERYPYKDANFTVNSDDEDIPANDLIRKTIERNTLRRSLQRYPRGAGGENRKRGIKKKIEPTLEERIKQLTCDLDDEQLQQSNVTNAMPDTEPNQLPQPIPATNFGLVIPPRTSPSGEESHRPEAQPQPPTTSSAINKTEKSTYKKFTDLFRNSKSSHNMAENHQQNMQPPTASTLTQQHYPYYQQASVPTQPDLGIDMKLQGGTMIVSKKAGSNDTRKQFLSSLAPLTACVTGHTEPHYSNRETLKLKLPGDRHSLVSNASTTGTNYSIGDIDDALSKPVEEKAPQPDVVAGTPSATDGGHDELAMFVQQDAGRIERIKKRYSSTSAAGSSTATTSDDDEHDDYGFSRRPSVRGIKPRFGSTTEILQQMQAHLQPPSLLASCPSKASSHMTWPYYSAEFPPPDNKSNASGAISPRSNPLPVLKEENNSTAEYTAKLVWEKSSTIPARVGPMPTSANNVHMFRLTPSSDTMAEVAAVPYKCDATVDPRRFSSSNVFQMKVSPVAPTQVRLPMPPDGQFTTHPIPVGTTSVIRVGHGQQQTFRVPCPVSGPVQVHLLATHHYENPQIRSSHAIHFPPQIVVAKGTQTSTISTTSFYQLQTNTQNYPTTSTTAAVTTVGGATPSIRTVTGNETKLIQFNYATTNAIHQSPPISSLNSSPTRVKSQNQIAERGIPEGAVSSSLVFAQDCVKPMSIAPSSTTTDSAVNSQGKSGSVVYGMKV